MRIVVADGRPEASATRCGWIASRFPGTEIFATQSLTEALRTLVEHHPTGLALLDLRTAGMNGFQGLSAVRRFFPEVRCVVSGSPETETLSEILRLDVHGFLADDLSEAEFAAALTTVLSGGRHIPSPRRAAARGSPGSDHPAVASLTPRELDILLLLSEGLPNKVIANRLAVSEVTVKSHLGNAFRKLGVHNRLQALRIMVEARIST